MDHNFAFVGFGAFALKPIHEKHMPVLYRKMALLGYLNRSILNSFSREIQNLAEQWLLGCRLILSNTNSLRARFLRWSNLFWFDQVFTQMQAVDLFDLMNKQSYAQREFNFVHDELARTGEFVLASASEDERQRQSYMSWLTMAVPFLAVFGVLYSAISSGEPNWFFNLFAPCHGCGGLKDWALELAGAVSTMIFGIALWTKFTPMPSGSRWRQALLVGIFPMILMILSVLHWFTL